MTQAPLRPRRAERHIVRILTGYIDLIKEGGSGAELSHYRNTWGVTSCWIAKETRKRKINLPPRDGRLISKGGVAVPNFYFGRLGPL